MRFLCKHNYFANNKTPNYGNGTKYVVAKCIHCGDERVFSMADNSGHSLSLGTLDAKKTLIMDSENYQLISDGYHTFEELYDHRMVLFASLCNSNKDISWKSRLHHDGTMYDDYFIVGMDTPVGQVQYHYPIGSWGHFNVRELENAPQWDGHTSKDVIERLMTAFCKQT